MEYTTHTVEEFHSLLTDLDDPFRLEQPREWTPERALEKFARLVARLEAEFGSCTVAPPDTVAVATLRTTVVTDRFATVAGALVNGEDVLLDQDSTLVSVLYECGYGYRYPARPTPDRPDRAHRRLLRGRTPDDLADQVRRLPVDHHPELVRLRHRLCTTLRLPVRPHPARSRWVDLLPGERVLAEVERLTACLATLDLPPDAPERLWPAIDDEILDRRNIPAIKAIKTVFGIELSEAVLRFHDHVTDLRRTRRHGWFTPG
ncbi:hypothetical protein [Actinokineospora inagensis]|uniref:hypothetical protein n=1 Tax=Actinokineospora inagensis TaxID=103730 RepID=UPI000409FBEF|nr:hypothetical protein [Actinokineospora inagensis]